MAIFRSVIAQITPFRIVASLVRAQPLIFLRNILRWLLVAIPATWTNSWLSYIQNKLAIAYRTRLTQEVMKQYLGEEGDNTSGKIYYKLGAFPYFSTRIVYIVPLANLDDRIRNADQYAPTYPRV